MLLATSLLSLLFISGEPFSYTTFIFYSLTSQPTASDVSLAFCPHFEWIVGRKPDLRAHFNHNPEFADVWSECEKKPQLTITAPRELVALSDSCLEISCSFSPASDWSEKFDSALDISGVWIKNDPRFEREKHNVIFNSSAEPSEYLMELTGKLSQRNCTTLFSHVATAYSNWYYFRVESKPFKATASCHPVKIQVQGKKFSRRSLAALAVLVL